MTKKPYTIPEESDGERAVKAALKHKKIHFQQECEIRGLIGDSKKFRRADFYLPDYGIYIEFFGGWNSRDPEKRRHERTRYQEKKEIYDANGIRWFPIYPNQLLSVSRVISENLEKFSEPESPEEEIFPAPESAQLTINPMVIKIGLVLLFLLIAVPFLLSLIQLIYTQYFVPTFGAYFTPKTVTTTTGVTSLDYSKVITPLSSHKSYNCNGELSCFAERLKICSIGTYVQFSISPDVGPNKYYLEILESKSPTDCAIYSEHSYYNSASDLQNNVNGVLTQKEVHEADPQQIQKFWEEMDLDKCFRTYNCHGN